MVAPSLPVQPALRAMVLAGTTSGVLFRENSALTGHYVSVFPIGQS